MPLGHPQSATNEVLKKVDIAEIHSSQLITNIFSELFYFFEHNSPTHSCFDSVLLGILIIQRNEKVMQNEKWWWKG